MFKAFLKKMIKMCDISLRLHGDDLTVVITFHGADIYRKTFDLLKDGIK